MLTVVPGDGSGHEGGKDGSPSLIDEIVREGARRMLAEALQAEVDAYIAALAAERGEDGRRLVVRNGYHQPREILTSAGTKSPLDSPCRYKSGSTSVIFGVLHAHAGRIAEANRFRSPVSRSTRL